MSTPLSSAFVKEEALKLGFSACGIAQAAPVDDKAAQKFSTWIEHNYCADMDYMRNYADKRLDPRLLMDGACSIISVALNYYPATTLPHDSYQLASYAYGKDYHDVVKAKLNILLQQLINKSESTPQARVFCDSAPLLERYWAQQAGLGWIGKNDLLIIPHAGSYFFLGEILIDRPFDNYDSPHPNRCGNCRKCIDNCPTKALGDTYGLNAGLCLSYLTIENRKEIPPSESLKMGNTIYGCDRCLQACPWNRFATPTKVTEFMPSDELLRMSKDDWKSLSVEHYRRLFKGSAVKRAKYEGLLRNIKAVE